MGWIAEPVVAQDHAATLDLAGQQPQFLFRLVIAVGRVEIHPVEKVIRKRRQHRFVRPDMHHHPLDRDFPSKPMADVRQCLPGGFAACRPRPLVAKQVPRVDEVQLLRLQRVQQCMREEALLYANFRANPAIDAQRT